MSEWQPIETAPRDGTRILVTGGGLGDEVDAATYSERVGCWCCTDVTLEDGYDSQGYSAPTDWMPLPDPPKTKEKAA